MFAFLQSFKMCSLPSSAISSTCLHSVGILVTPSCPSTLFAKPCSRRLSLFFGFSLHCLVTHTLHLSSVWAVFTHIPRNLKRWVVAALSLLQFLNNFSQGLWQKYAPFVAHAKVILLVLLLLPRNLIVTLDLLKASLPDSLCFLPSLTL